MRLFIFIFFVSFPYISIGDTSVSKILNQKGEACQSGIDGEDKSEEQLKLAAIDNAKFYAASSVGSRISGVDASNVATSTVNGNEGVVTLNKSSYRSEVRADVNVLSTPNGVWSVNENNQLCYQVEVKLEVIPLEEQSVVESDFNDPSLPLRVQIFADRSKASEIATYRVGDEMKFYIRGNKPFYARVIYTNVDGTTLQVLPSPVVKNNYFEGGVVTMFPLENQPNTPLSDQLRFVVEQPVGKEKITLYASDKPLGDNLNLSEVGNLVYAVNDSAENIERIVKLPSSAEDSFKELDSETSSFTAEFSSSSVDIITLP